MKPNIYLDVDGVLLAHRGVPAKHADRFIRTITRKYPVYWLSEHCQGDANNVLSILRYKIDGETFEMLLKIQPTSWEEDRTEAIDITRPFLWFSDMIYLEEKLELRKHNVLRNWIKIDLYKNENQLAELIKNFPVPVNLPKLPTR